MLCDVTLDSNFDELDKHDNKFIDQNLSSAKELHKTIFVSNYDRHTLTERVTLQVKETETTKKIKNKFFYKNAETKLMAHGGGGASATIEATVSWGGSEGPTGNLNFSIEARDNRGNQVKTTVSHDSNGNGKATMSATAGNKSNR